MLNPNTQTSADFYLYLSVVLAYVAQGNPQPDAEIAEKRPFWTGTSPTIDPSCSNVSLAYRF